MEAVVEKYDGIYIVSETGCLIPTSGANLHIEAGIVQLSKYFSIKLILFCKPYLERKPVSVNKTSIKPFDKHYKSGSLKSGFSWTLILLSNHLSFFKRYRQIKRENPAFIYERAGYLNYNALWISKILNIPHFYEVNGILANDYSKFYPAFCNRLALRMERKAYNSSSFGFYVGGINAYFNIPSNKCSIVQNGIQRDFVDRFENRINTVSDKINIVFIGHPMFHHRLDLFCESIVLIKKPNCFKVHLIGPGLDFIKETLNPKVETEYYGELTGVSITALIGSFNIAIIPYALDYFSHVKVFMYGAAKLTLILPRTKNFTTIFSNEEALFVDNGNPKEIAEKLNWVCENPTYMKNYGQNLYNKIATEYTWEKIYYKVASDIRKLLK